MCLFFSFVSYDGNFYYINAEDRKKKLLKNPDSHTQICTFFKLREDMCNKYEYTKEKGLVIDSEVYVGDDVEGFIKKTLPKLVKIAIVTVVNYGKGITFVPEEARTSKFCLAAVNQNGSAVVHLTEKQRTSKICLEAVKQNGNAIWHLTESQKTPKVCLAAVLQNKDAYNYLTDS